MNNGSMGSWRAAAEPQDPPEMCSHGLPEDLCDREGLCCIEQLQDDVVELSRENDHLSSEFARVAELLARARQKAGAEKRRRIALERNLTAEIHGALALRRELGASPSETMCDFVRRLARSKICSSCNLPIGSGPNSCPGCGGLYMDGPEAR